MVKNLVVSIPPAAAATAVTKEITQVRTTDLLRLTTRGQLLDDYRIETSAGTFICQVFTMYYARIGSYVTLVVTITDTLGTTTVHVTTGGHKRNADPDTESDYDFGASASIVKKVEHALQAHIVSPD